MTTDEKLAAILAAVQTDPGNRGLARDPEDNLFTATKGDFAAACRSIAEHPAPHLGIATGFYIPTGTPPALETDGWLGAAFLARALLTEQLSMLPIALFVDPEGRTLSRRLMDQFGPGMVLAAEIPPPSRYATDYRQGVDLLRPLPRITHLVSLERAGRGTDGCYRNMRGKDISPQTLPADRLFEAFQATDPGVCTIGIGDGGNEIGMGKIPHETIVKNIPNGDLIHCRVPTDFLIVAGVSNWGAYALAAGIYALRGVKPPPDLFDPDREHQILEVMVREGPLVDGVTGKQTATVDGLSWDEYAEPLIRIREILES